ncbi:MAG: Zn-dependent hydrolase [Chloroflexi bacterium]|nr:Zn-dependent hydrolase [Chloroflexota bacterium]
MSSQPLTIEPDLVASYLEQLDQIGRLPGGGVWRGAYSAAWDEARQVVRGWLSEAGLSVREDAAGNLFGRLDGAVSGPVILAGSHIDSVYAGGKFDGPLGVVGAIAAVRALRSRYPRPARPVEVFVSAEEENSRFICNFWGARAVAGGIAPDEPDRYHDADGIALADAMRGVGLDPNRITDARRDDIAAFLELHIEQGPVLDTAGIALGVVEAVSGVTRTRLRVTGRADHAGSTPMAMRADALLAAAEMVQMVRALALETGEPARATVGRLTVQPNQPVIIAGEAELIVDCRHPNRTGQERMVAAVHERCGAIAASHSLALATEVIVDQPPSPMDPELVARLEGVIARRGWSQRRLISGPGHDAMILARRFPTVMLFVPSRDGRSHSPAEFTPFEQLIPGVQALADTIEALATQPVA